MLSSKNGINSSVTSVMKHGQLVLIQMNLGSFAPDAKELSVKLNFFSSDNDMDPGEVPPCLEGLTQVEEMLIARAHPIMSVYRRKGGQHGYSGHIINLPQDIQGFLNQLPYHISGLPLLVIRQQGANDTHKDWRVRTS